MVDHSSEWPPSELQARFGYSGSGFVAPSNSSFTFQVPNPTSAPVLRKDSPKKVAKNSRIKRDGPVCWPCTKGKVACDRESPCGRCTSVGRECTSVPLTRPRSVTQDKIPSLRSDHDNEELKNQVQKLQQLVDKLLEPYFVNVVSHLTSKSSPDTDRSSKAGDLSEESEEDEVYDARELDLCQGLSNLALGGIVNQTVEYGEMAFAPDHRNSGKTFITEAKSFCEKLARDNQTPAQPKAPRSVEEREQRLLKLPTPFGTKSLFDENPTLELILQFLPSPEDLPIVLGLFTKLFPIYFYTISPEPFIRRVGKLQQTLAMSDSPEKVKALKDQMSFIALFYAGLVNGASMTEEEGSRFRVGFPVISDCRRKIGGWATASMLALISSKFGEKPSVDSVASVTLLILFIAYWHGGDTLSLSLGLLTLAVDSAYRLNLHRDPDSLKGVKFTLEEAEERRLTWWALFNVAAEVTGHYGQKLPAINIGQVDTKLPINCLPEELVMPSVEGRRRAEEREAKAKTENGGRELLSSLTVVSFRMRSSYIIKQCDDKMYGTKSSLYKTVLAFHEEFVQLENSLPASCESKEDENGRFLVFPTDITGSQASLTHFFLGVAILRIHRPFLILAGIDSKFEFSRKVVLKYAERVIAIALMPENKKNWGIQNFSVVSTCVLLGIDLLQSPNQPDAKRLYDLITNACELFEYFADLSSLCRKGANLIRFLLSKHQAAQNLKEQPSASKRMRKETVRSVLSENFGLSMDELDTTWASLDEERLRKPLKKHPA